MLPEEDLTFASIMCIKQAERPFFVLNVFDQINVTLIPKLLFRNS